MGATYRFLATIDEAPMVAEWFRALVPQPTEQQSDRGICFFFPDLSPLDDGDVKPPLVTLFMPLRRRGVLTTAGEVHFLPTPITKFPSLNAVNRRFRNWLEQFPCVFSRRKDFVGEWDYYTRSNLR